MNARRVYLLLFLAGVVIPYLEFGPWVAEHGLNFPLMIDQLFANRIGAFFGADVAVSAGLPLLLYLREGRHAERSSAQISL